MSEKITYSPTDARSLVVAAVLSGRDAGATVGVDRRRKVSDETLNEKPFKGSYLLSLIDDEFIDSEDNKDGKFIKSAILGLHSDLEDVENVRLLRRAHEYDTSALKQLVSEGKTIHKYRESESFSKEFGLDEIEEEETDEPTVGAEETPGAQTDKIEPISETGAQVNSDTPAAEPDDKKIKLGSSKAEGTGTRQNAQPIKTTKATEENAVNQHAEPIEGSDRDGTQSKED